MVIINYEQIQNEDILFVRFYENSEIDISDWIKVYSKLFPKCKIVPVPKEINLEFYCKNLNNIYKSVFDSNLSI